MLGRWTSGIEALTFIWSRLMTRTTGVMPGAKELPSSAMMWSTIPSKGAVICVFATWSCICAMLFSKLLNWVSDCRYCISEPIFCSHKRCWRSKVVLARAYWISNCCNWSIIPLSESTAKTCPFLTRCPSFTATFFNKAGISGYITMFRSVSNVPWKLT